MEQPARAKIVVAEVIIAIITAPVTVPVAACIVTAGLIGSIYSSTN